MPKKIFLLLSIFFSFFFLFTTTSFAQLASPYNLNFELGSEGSVAFGWTLGQNATGNGYTALISENLPVDGLVSTKITNVNKKKLPKDTAGSFYQRVKAKHYLNKIIRFSAFVKPGEAQTGLVQQKDGTTNINDIVSTAPVYLFMNAKDKNGYNIAQNVSTGINRRGWNLYSIEINVPPNTDDITFGINFSDTNDVYIDNCSIEIISNDSLYYTASSQLTINELMYLVPLASIAGQVQYFHPSKNASEANWNKVLLNALAQMKNINEKYSTIANSSEFADTLNQTILDSLKTFFAPYCPSLELANNPSKITNFDLPAHKHLFAWLHSGVPNNMDDNLTNSYIVDLNSPILYEEAIVAQYVNMNKQQGKEILLKAKTKLNKYHKGAVASISIRFENALGEYISFLKKEITNAENWTQYEILGEIPANAASAMLILSLRGYAKCYFDDISLHYKEGRTAVPFSLNNADFERALPFDQSNWLTTNATEASGYRLMYDTHEVAAGKQALAVFNDSLALPNFPPEDSNAISITTNYILNSDIVKTLYPNLPDITGSIKPIFAALPRFVPAESFWDSTSRSQEDTLFRQSQLTNYETYPIAKLPIIQRTDKPLDFNLTWKDRDSRLIFIINLYNIAKMFNVFDAITNNANWQKVDSLFIVNLRRGAECSDKKQFLQIINDMLQVFDDARTRAWIENDYSKSYSIPMNWELLNNKLYVTQVEEAYQSYIQPGSEITKINGKTINELVDFDNNKLEWKNYFDLVKLKLGKLNDKIELETKYNDKVTTFPLAYNTLPSKLVYREVDYWQHINDSIVYIDLSAYSDKDINKAFDSLKRYKHWIFDIRNETLASDIVVSLYANSIYKTAQTLVPYWTFGQAQGAAEVRFVPPSKSKQIEGKVVFLTNWKTFGLGELLAATVKQQKEGILIGQATQGAAVSSVAIKLDEDFSVSLPTELGFTPSGISLYKNPIQPDITVTPTSWNIHKDYILEAAIKYLEE